MMSALRSSTRPLRPHCAGRARKFRARLLTACLLGAIGALGCSSSATGPRFGGSYTLTAIGSSPLPAVLSRTVTQTATGTSTRSDEVLSEVLTLSVDRTFVSTMRMRITIDGSASESTSTATGPYETRGDTIVLRFERGGPTELAVSERGATLRGLTDFGTRLTYHRISPN